MTSIKRIIPLLLLILVSLPVWADTPIPRQTVSNLPDDVSTIWVLGDLEPVARALTWSALLFNSNTGSFALGVMQVALVVASGMVALNVATTGQLLHFRNLVLIVFFAILMGPSMSVKVANAYDSGLENAGAVRFKQVDNVPLALGLMMGTLSKLSNGTTQKINTVTQSVPDTNWSAVGAADMGTLSGGLSLYGSRGMHSPLRVAIALRSAFAKSGNPLISANMALAARDCHQWRTRWDETRKRGFLNLLTDKQQAGETSIWVQGEDGKRILTQMNCADAGKVIAAQSLAQTTPKAGQEASETAKGISLSQSTNINVHSQSTASSAARVQKELQQLPSALASVAGGGGNDDPHNVLAYAFQRASQQGGRFNPNEMAQFYSAGIQIDAASIQSSLMLNRLAERCIGELDNTCAKAEQIMGEALTTSAVDVAGEATGWANTYEKFFNFMLAFFILFTVIMVPIVMVKGVKSFMILGAYIGMAVWLFLLPPVQAGVGHFFQSSLTDKLYAIAVELVAGGDAAKLLSPEFSVRVFDELNKTILTGSTIMSGVSGLALFLVLGSAYVFNGIANRAGMVGANVINENTEAPRLDESRVIGAGNMIEQSSMGGPLADAQRLMANAEARSGHAINLSSSQGITDAAKASVARQLSMVDTDNKTITWAHVDSNGVATSDGFTLNRGKDGSLALNYAQKGDQVLRDSEQYAIAATGTVGARGQVGLEVVGNGGGISGDANISGRKTGTADNSVSYTDSSGQTHTLTASTSLADIQSINSTFGSIDSNSISQAYSQAVSDLRSDQHSLETAANTTVAGGAQASIDAQHFSTVGLMADRDNATAQLAQAAAAAEKYDKGVAESIRQAYDRGGNVGADTFNALYAASSGSSSEQMAAAAALKAVYGYNQSPVAQSYASMLESRMDVLEHTQRMGAEARSALDAPVNAADARNVGSFGNQLDTGRLNGIEERVASGRAASDEMGRNIRDHEKIMQHNMAARQKDMQEIMDINRELRERAPSEKLADNLTGGTAATLTKLVDEMRKGDYSSLLKLANPSAMGTQMAADSLGSQAGSNFESGKSFSVDPKILSLMERKIELEERVKNYDPNNTTKVYDDTPIEQILGYTPSESRVGPRANIGDGTQTVPGSSRTEGATLPTGREGIDHLQRNRAFGGESANGIKTHPGTLAAAHAMERLFDGSRQHDVRFSAFNDTFHADSRPNSLHTKGLAWDLVLDKEGKSTDGMHSGYQGWQETVAGIKQFMNENGFSHGNRKSGADYMVMYEPAGGGSTGNHIHFQFNNAEAAARFADLAQTGRISGLAQDYPAPSGGTPVPGSGFAAEIKQLMAKAEGNYNSVNFGGKLGNGSGSRDLGNMTVNQILGAMKRDEFDAVGKYQIVPKTFEAAVRSLNISGNEKFTPQLQERLFNDYLIQKAGGGAAYAYIQGKHNDLNKALTAMAQEWASFPVPHDMKGHVQQVKAGQSYYQGYHGNKSNLSLNEARSALVAARMSFGKQP